MLKSCGWVGDVGALGPNFRLGLGLRLRLRLGLGPGLDNNVFFSKFLASQLAHVCIQDG